MKAEGIVDKETGAINLAKLSEYNDKSEVENAKWIIEFLQLKAEFYNIPQKVLLTFPKETG